MSNSHGPATLPPLSMTLMSRAAKTSALPSLPTGSAVPLIDSLTLDEIHSIMEAIIDMEVWSYALESLFYGVFLVLWVYTVVILLDRRRKAIGQRVNYFILACAFILFGTITTVRSSCVESRVAN